MALTATTSSSRHSWRQAAERLRYGAQQEAPPSSAPPSAAASSLSEPPAAASLSRHISHYSQPVVLRRLCTSWAARDWDATRLESALPT
eukprot:6889313-Prymnesium_polylepis.1